MGQALFYKRMHGLKQKIYRWKQYNVNTTYTYYWNRYNVVSTTTYKWDKYNRVSTTKYTWNKWNVSYTSATTIGENGIVNIRAYTNQTDMYITYTNKYMSGGYLTITGTITGAYYSSLAQNENTRAGAVPGMRTITENGTLYYVVCKYSDLPLSNGDPSHPDLKGCKYAIIAMDTLNLVQYSHCDYKGYVMDVRETKGSLVGTVTSTSSTAYPNGGSQDGYYYDGRTSSVEYSKGSTSYGQVTSTSSSAYPSNGYSGSYWYISAGSDTSYSKGSTKYSDVSSTNSSAYPDNGKSGSYWYVYSRSTTSYSQGSYIGDKLSTNRNEYPDNGKSGSYWYVFDGEA